VREESDPVTAPVVAIDGPAGSGKSTTAAYLAERLGLLNVDTGAMYRAVTRAALDAGIDAGDGQALANLLAGARLELQAAPNAAVRVLWNGQDLSRAIRTPEVDGAVSRVSAHGAVRKLLVERQRVMARRGGVVMEGRDIGTIVLPLATAKLYLDGSPAARAERRLRQYNLEGRQVDRERLEEELRRRDRLDSERPDSPLTIPADAVYLDTSGWTLAEQKAQALRTVQQLLGEQERQPAPTTASWPWKYRLAYGCLGAAARFYGLRVIGPEHLRREGGAILASNHISWWDPPLVGSTFRRAPVRTLAKAELFRPPPFGALFRWLEAIPIERSGYDRRAFGEAVAALENGGSVFIFPEGTRRPIGRPGPVRSGLGILMQRTGAPVVPIFVRGTCCLRPGGAADSPLEVRFGRALRLRSLAALRTHHDARQISRLIGRLFEQVLRELQARSLAARPLTAWEEAAGELQAAAYRQKEERIFGQREGGSPAPRREG
jgi:cytidylate kinase